MSQVIGFPPSGVCVPMITPLDDEGGVDAGAMAQLVEHLLDGGVSGLFVLGGAGEGPWLTPSQQSATIEHAVRAVAGRVPVIAGCLEPSAARCVEAVKMIESAGADALALASPYYFNADGVLQVHHFHVIAAATSLPLMLYDIPSTTHNPFALDTIRQLLAIDSLMLIKDSTGNWDRFQHVLHAREDRPDVRILQGIDALALRSIKAGADGVLTGLTNLSPELFARLVDRAQAEDVEAAEALQASIDSLCEIYRQGYWLECLKFAVSCLGISSGDLCSRPATLAPDGKDRIRQIVAKLA